MSQMQRYLTEVLGLNYVIKPNKSDVVLLAADSFQNIEEVAQSAVMPTVEPATTAAAIQPTMQAVPPATTPVKEPTPALKVKPAVVPKAKPKAQDAPKKLSLDKIPDIVIRINPKAKILFLVPEKIKPSENEVLHNISKACHPRPVILVNARQLKNESYLKELSESNISHGFCFGAEPFKAISEASFFDYFKKQTEAFGLKWIATHSLQKLSDKKSENLKTFKKETWSQLQMLFKETQ